MKRSHFRGSWLVALVAAVPLAALAAAPAKKTEFKPEGKIVEMFDGMKSGEIEVNVIPKDSKEGLVTIKNKTDKPLTIKLPEAFAGVPVAAQFGAGGGGGGQFGGGGGGGAQQNQGFAGGGMQGAGMGGMGGQAGGFFNVAPEKAAKVKIVTVCMDHGKKDPNPRVPYTLIPIESYAKDPAITHVVGMMCRSEIDQHTAQAATWHLQNGLSWEELAAKIGVKHLNGSTEPYFTMSHLERALAVTREAQRRAEASAKEKPAVKSPGESVAQQ